MQLCNEWVLPKLIENGNNLKELLNVTTLGKYIHCMYSKNGEGKSMG